MKREDIHNNQWSDEDFMKSLPEVELPFAKSKEEVWAALSVAMEQSEPPIIQLEKKGIFSLHKAFYLAAAILVLSLSTTAFLRLYTKTFSTGSGQQLTALLPDGSSIELNAGSTIKYHPYWWTFNRQVQFEGEGFFKVQKGKSFEVLSAKGKTIVLGTSFNIYARQDDYKVTCFTGKVRVVSVESGLSADITPQEQAIVDKNGRVVSRMQNNSDETISWIKGMFIFTGTPVERVFEEIERQYGVTIKLTNKLSYNYTGNFIREQSADDALHKVCLALGLHYKKVNNSYLVSK